MARRFLTDRRIGWLAEASESAQDECLDALESHPARFSWVGFAFYADRQRLPERLAQLATKRWRQLTRTRRMPAQTLVAMSTALLGLLTVADREQALALVDAAPSEWRPFLLDAHADTAGSLELKEHRDHAMSELLNAVEDAQRPTSERLNSALMVLRRWPEIPSEDARSLAQQLVRAARQPPLRDHRALQREIRRLGLDAIPSTG
jgi:hypothetical protein